VLVRAPDARFKVLVAAIGAELGGAVRHLTNLLPELGSADTKRQYVVLVRESFPAIETAGNIRIERVPNRAANSWLGRLFYDLVELPLRVRRENFSLVISILNTGPLWVSVPHILFQRNSLYFCEFYLSELRGLRAAETYLRRRLAIATMARADCVVTPSNAMADMIRRSCPSLDRNRFSILPHGYRGADLAQPLDSVFSHRLEQSDGVRLLYPAHPAPHKGFPLLFEALALLRRRGTNATLFATVDPADWPDEVASYQQHIADLQLDGAVVFLGRVPQMQMGAVYSRCDLMVYPSLCESFGFPMVEAMAHQLPIVAAETAVNQEICGNAALYFEPLDPEDACKTIEQALTAGVRAELAKNGEARMNGFDWSWARYAKDFMQLIEAVG
jgi:glycosyltransferase involved in cell wall biosynthesis